MTDQTMRKIALNDFSALHLLFGNLDENIKIIEQSFNVLIAARDGEIIVQGDTQNVSLAIDAIEIIIQNIKSGEIIDRQRVNYIVQSVHGGEGQKLEDLNKSFICVTARGKYIKPKTLGQNQYIKSIQAKDVVFGIGPAGTGKTYLAVAMAVRAFKNNEINRIILTRPAVEAGESLGFLPGDLQMKVDPYLRPLYDALYDILGADTYNSFKERGLIEIAPLAYMRGRTLDNAFIILDEAQNTTREQMKMFLTRFGFGSKVIVNGDITQIDLPSGKKSGLVHAIEVLKNVEEIGMVKLTERDVVRHELVKKIILSYDRYEKKIEVHKNEKK
ncbi:PhoH family protein [Fusibacter tunisiensis]|uniref:PhoH-like protein n=1 Tax=Fusibacter tunisiensis TaxID=1008308 RepID=A0ABS2MMU1_9FIRM|nr:PhoH family protein [Fusibacter tunisiensis]MBM7560711.1 phosphate starvation-inducible PhoH-like protein [Fusibacter tunisiensis]